MTFPRFNIARAVVLAVAAAAVAMANAHAETVTLQVGQRQVVIDDTAPTDAPATLDIHDSTGKELKLVAGRADNAEALFSWDPLSTEALVLGAPAIDRFLHAHPDTLEAVRALMLEKGDDPAYVNSVVDEVKTNGFLHYRDRFYTTISQYQQGLQDAARTGEFPAPFTRQATPPTPLATDALIVTHASRAFDSNGCAKAALDDEIERFKKRLLPIIYLVHDDGIQDYSYYMADRKAATAVLASGGGEHTLAFDSDTVTVAGGYFNQCLYRTVKDAAAHYFDRHPESHAFNVRLRAGAVFAGINPRWEEFPDRSSALRHDYRNLDEVYRELGEEKFLAYVRTTYLDAPDANAGDKPFDPKTYTIHCRIDGREAASFGSGARQLDLDFELEGAQPKH